VAITVQTSARREIKLRQAAAEGRDVYQIFGDSIARQWHKRGLTVPPTIFALETSPKTGRLHIHGWFIAPSAAHEEAARDVYTHGLGKIKGRSGSPQYDSEDLYTPEKWRAYFSKDENRVRQNLGVERLLYINNEMRRFARDFHEARRKPCPATTDELTAIDLELAALDLVATPSAEPIPAPIDLLARRKATLAARKARLDSHSPASARGSISAHRHPARREASQRPSMSQGKPIRPRKTSPPSTAPPLQIAQ
jgi:hypothetical protein